MMCGWPLHTGGVRPSCRPPGTWICQNAKAIECGMFLVHGHYLDAVRQSTPTMAVPTPSATYADWVGATRAVDVTRADDAPQLSPGSAAREWANERIPSHVAVAAARWMRSFHRAYLGIRRLIGTITAPMPELAFATTPRVAPPLTGRTREGARARMEAVALVTRLLITGRDAMISSYLVDAIQLANRFPDGTVEIHAVPRQVLRHAAHWAELTRRAGEDTRTSGPVEVTHAAVASSDARVVDMRSLQAQLGDGRALKIPLVEWDQLAIGTVNHHHFAARTGPHRRRAKQPITPCPLVPHRRADGRGRHTYPHSSRLPAGLGAIDPLPHSHHGALW